jgi:putative transcriptional regulator
MRTLYRIVLLVLLALAVQAGAPALAADDVPKTDVASVKGKFLVARPTLPDPYFAHTVILMLKHDATGAFGLVVNRPAGIAEVTPDAPGTTGDSAETKDAPAPEPLRFPATLGGPVGRERIFVVHSEDYTAKDTIHIAPQVSVTANVQILKDIADGKGPKRSLYVVGYAGWGAGQLEAEMARKSWYEAPVDPDLIFSGEDTDAVWEQALKLRLRKI